MKLDTAMNHESRLKGLAADVFYFARQSGYTHSHLLKNLKEKVYDDPAYGRVPGWVIQRLKQRIDDSYNRMYQPDMSATELLRAVHRGSRDLVPYVRWQLRVDGKFVDTDEICLRRAAGDDEIWQRVEGAHVWNHKPENTYSEGWTLSAGVSIKEDSKP